MLHSILALAMNASIACGSPQACQTTKPARSCCGSPAVAEQLTVGDLDGMSVRCNGKPATLRKVDNAAWAIVCEGQVRGMASLVRTTQGAELVATGIHTSNAVPFGCCSKKPEATARNCCSAPQTRQANLRATGFCKPAG